MSEVRRWAHTVVWEGQQISATYMAINDGGEYVMHDDYAALEAELARLRAGQESLLLNLADQKRQAVEYRAMWAKTSERARSQSSDLTFLAEFIVGREYGTALPNYEALGRYPADVAEAAIAAARQEGGK